MNSKINLIELKDIFQDCNINFLLGAGMSVPYFPTLGNIEQLLTDVDSNNSLSDDQRLIIRTSLYKKYFDSIILGNINILEGSEDSNLLEVTNSYKNFLKILNSIILNRKSTILSSQINIFTTNIDIFLEKTLEDSAVEYNDGFCGRFNPMFDLVNLKKSYFRKSLHYDNSSELPVFNLMKIHGSLTWNRRGDDENIAFSNNLNLIKTLKEISISEDSLIKINNESSLQDLIDASNSNAVDETLKNFKSEYEKLAIVNPSKEKFKDTVLNQTYYEMLRIFSNELEKENTVLFVLGFSFADEHIRKMIVRAANFNPTLKVCVFAHTEKSKVDIQDQINKSKSNNKNIQIYSPNDLVTDEPGDVDIKFDLKTMNEKIWGTILTLIDKNDN